MPRHLPLLPRTHARSSRAGLFVARPPLVALLALLLAAALSWPALALAQDDPGSPAATPTAGDPVARAAAWLVSQQGADGGFAGFSGASEPGVTTDAVYALKAAELRGAPVAAPLAAAGDYLLGADPGYAATGPGQAAKVVMALVAVGVEPPDLAGAEGEAPPGVATPDPGTGFYGAGVYDHALVLLALAATGDPILPADVEALRAAQTPDGSWAFDGTPDAGAGDSNTTALVVQALLAAGHGDDPMVPAALDYLRGIQAEGGGVPFQPGGAPDGNSTALAVQAIVAVGQDPSTAAWRDAAGALVGFQNASGAIRYTDAEPADNLFATVQALPALAGFPLPVVEACANAVEPVGTPVVALPDPGRGQAPCVELEAA